MSVVMADTPSAAAPHRESLRAAAARMAEQMPGYRVEILEGNLIVSPTPSFMHNGIVSDIMIEIAARLPAGRSPVQATAVESAESTQDDEDYSIPDLMIVPSKIKKQKGWLLSADATDFVVEVVSPGSSTMDTRTKPREYARWHIPIYLVADPRDGSIVLYADPRDGAYQSVHRMRFGDTVVLPEPLNGVRITTEDFPYYDE